MGKDAIGEMRVKENGRELGELGGSIQPPCSLRQSPMPAEQPHVPRSWSVSVFAACKPSLERPVVRLSSADGFQSRVRALWLEACKIQSHGHPRWHRRICEMQLR